MSFPVYYRTWDTAANEPKTGDATNHTVTLVVNGVDVGGLTPSEVGDGLYVVLPLYLVGDSAMTEADVHVDEQSVLRSIPAMAAVLCIAEAMG